MLYFGDRMVETGTREKLDRIRTAVASARQFGAGIEAHSKLVHAFVEGTELAHGIADWETVHLGGDGPGPAQALSIDLLMEIARAVSTSWETQFNTILDVSVLAEVPPSWPPSVVCKEMEGYSYYSVYPEAYYEAAKALRGRAVDVIGLRSIGIGLAAMVSVGAQAEAPISIRPYGDPFDRKADLSRFPDLARSSAEIAIVDEGPGLSGSSFAAAAQAVEDLRGPETPVIYFPSHAGYPGSQSSETVRARWRKADRLQISFENIFLREDSRALSTWFSDITGAVHRIEDLSAGGWCVKHRNCAGVPPLIDPQRERRKYLLHGRNGLFLAKFAGLGRPGAVKLERANQLSGQGFVVKPLALRHGFILEPWLEAVTRGVAETTDPNFLARIADYLSFRAKQFTCTRSDGASPSDLYRMMRINAGRSLGVEAPLYDPRELARLEQQIVPVATDNRMHAWEWLCHGGVYLKTDALDHCMAHDLVGCQDVAWDVAGAICELDLDNSAAVFLLDGMQQRGIRISQRLLRFYRVCYAAFQLAAWSFDAQYARRAFDKYSRELTETAHETA